MPVMPTGEQILEQGKSAVTNAVKSTVSDISDSVSGQIGLKNEQNATQSQSQNQPQDQTQQAEAGHLETERTKEMVRDFYSPSDDLVQSGQQASVSEDQQLAQVRQRLQQELHSQVYYEPLFAYEHNLNQTESKQEELERRDKQEMMELQQKQADAPPPLAVSRAQTHTETNPGVAG